MTLREKIFDHLLTNGWVAPIDGYWRHPERGFVCRLEGAIAWQFEREGQGTHETIHVSPEA